MEPKLRLYVQPFDASTSKSIAGLLQESVDERQSSIHVIGDTVPRPMWEVTVDELYRLILSRDETHLDFRIFACSSTEVPATEIYVEPQKTQRVGHRPHNNVGMLGHNAGSSTIRLMIGFHNEEALEAGIGDSPEVLFRDLFQSGDICRASTLLVSLPRDRRSFKAKVPTEAPPPKQVRPAHCSHHHEQHLRRRRRG